MPWIMEGVLRARFAALFLERGFGFAWNRISGAGRSSATFPRSGCARRDRRHCHPHIAHHEVERHY
jgi:hypothetical protein